MDAVETTNAQIHAHCCFCPHTLPQLGSSTVAALYVQQHDPIDTFIDSGNCVGIIGSEMND